MLCLIVSFLFLCSSLATHHLHFFCSSSFPQFSPPFALFLFPSLSLIFFFTCSVVRILSRNFLRALIIIVCNFVWEGINLLADYYIPIRDIVSLYCMTWSLLIRLFIQYELIPYRLAVITVLGPGVVAVVIVVLVCCNTGGLLHAQHDTLAQLKIERKKRKEEKYTPFACPRRFDIVIINFKCWYRCNSTYFIHYISSSTIAQSS